MARKVIRAVLRGVGLTVKGTLRAFGLLVLFLALLGAAAYVTVSRMFNEEQAKSMIASAFQDALRRPVQIDGVVLSPQGIKLRGVRVFDRPEFSRGPWLTSESALVTINLAALLTSRIELGTVRLLNPQIEVFREPGGRWNVGDLFTSEPARGLEPESEPGGLPFSLAAAKTVIEGGRVRIEDRHEARTFSIDKFNLAVDDFDSDRPFPVSVSFRNSNQFGGASVDTVWSFEGTADLASLDWSKASISAERLDVAVGGIPIKGAVSLKGFPDSEISWDLKIPEVAPRELERLIRRAPPFSLPATRLRGAARLEGRAIRFEKWSAASVPLSLTASGLLDYSSGTPRAAGVVTVPETSLAEAAALWPKLAPFGLRGRAQARISFAADPEQLELHDLRVSAKGFAARSKEGHRIAGADFTLEAEESFTRMSLSLSRGTAHLFGSEFGDVSGSASLKGGDLRVDSLSFRWGGSPARFKARLRPISDPKEVILSGRIEELRWEEAQRLAEAVSAKAQANAKAPPPAVSGRWLKTFKYVLPKRFPDSMGRIEVGKITQENFDCRDVELLWDIRGVSPTLRKVSGEVKVGFGPGRVNDIPTVQKSHNMLRIIFLPFIYMHKMNSLSVLSTRTAYPKTLDFNRIEGEYGLKQGVATTRYFFVDSPQLMVYADGTADFGREVVDQRILTRLTGYRGQLPEWWVDEAGRPAIGFRVKGDFNDAEIEPRLKKMRADEIETSREEGMARARAEFAAAEKLKAF